MDKTGEAYWSAIWCQRELPAPIRLSGRSLAAVCYRQFHQLWSRYLPPVSDCPVQFLEVGCARSVWLPYFARERGYAVTGLDYSEIGWILAREGVPEEIYHQDLFYPRPEQRQRFDLFFPNGEVQHFENLVKGLGLLTGWLGRGLLNLRPMQRTASYIVYIGLDYAAIIACNIANYMI